MSHSRLRLGGLILICNAGLGLLPAALAESPIAQSADNSGTSNSAGNTNKHGITLKPVSEKQEKQNDETAKAINKIPGVNLEGKDLQPPAPDPPIKGFHPIKRALQPVVALEKNSVQLQQQIMKLEGPISALQPAMNGLHKRLDGIDISMQGTTNNLTVIDKHMSVMDKHVLEVAEEMSDVRHTLGSMRKDLIQVKAPLHSLLGPLNNVAQPLVEVRKELSEMKALLATVLFAIVVAALGIAFGTPIAAVLIYKNRRKIFPNMSDREFPTAAAASPQDRGPKTSVGV